MWLISAGQERYFLHKNIPFPPIFKLPILRFGMVNGKVLQSPERSLAKILLGPIIYHLEHKRTNRQFWLET